MDSFIPWVGGKKLLRKEIVKRFPDNFKKYVEVFGGAAWVLFSQERIAEKEFYNDKNGELVNLFKMVKYHAEALEKELAFVLNSKEWFEQYQKQNVETMTEIQRAARYFYLIRSSYGARVEGFGYKNRDVTLIKDMQALQKRLAKVVIERRDYADIIKTKDSEKTLFYCDPPYYEAEKISHGYADFEEKDHVLLRDILKEIKGKCIVSYNDTDFIRELYKDFSMESIERNSNLTAHFGRSRKYAELIIKNF